MRKSKLAEEQIIAGPSEHKRGICTSDMFRKHGISAATFYKWKAKFGGMSVPDDHELKTLEGENAHTKLLPADAHVDISLSKDLLGKSRRRPKQGVTQLAVGCSSMRSPRGTPAAWLASIPRRCVLSMSRAAQRSEGRELGIFWNEWVAA